MSEKKPGKPANPAVTHRLPSAKEIKEIAAKIRKVFPDVSDDFVTKLVSAFLSGQFKWSFLKKYPIPHAIADDEKLREYVSGLKKKFRIRGPVVAKIAYDGRMSQDEFLLGQKRSRPAPPATKAPRKVELLVSSKVKRAPLVFLEHVVVHEFAHFKKKEHDKRFLDLCAGMQPDFLSVEIDLLWFLFYKDVMKVDLYGE